MDIYPAPAQRQALLELVPALGCRDSALHRDECGDWRINGSAGHIYAVPRSLDEPGKPGFMAYVSCETARGWTYAKKALSFAKVTNDGDHEGAFFLGRLPWKAEAEAIRYHCGIPKKRELSEQELERLRAAGREHGFTARRPSQIAA
jgi:hypothetical protein